MKTHLILEDNPGKVQKCISGMDGGDVIICVQNVAQAQLAMFTHFPSPYILYIDYELLPGCGDGHEFLIWALEHMKDKIDYINLITASLIHGRKMANLCKLHNMPFSTWW